MNNASNTHGFHGKDNEKLTNNIEKYTIEKVIDEEYCTAFLIRNIIYIKWHRDPTGNEVKKYISKLQEVFDNTPSPLYSLSDVSEGIIQREDLFELISFVNINERKGQWKGGSMYNSKDKIRPDEQFNYNVFRSVTATDNVDANYTSIEEAIAHLIRLSSNLEQFPWKAMLSSINIIISEEG